MTRTEFIDKLVAIYKLRYKPTEVEIEEFRLLLEMMPNASVTLTPSSPLWPRDINGEPFPEPPISVAYGCLPPVHVMYGVSYPDITYSGQANGYHNSSVTTRDLSDISTPTNEKK